MPLSTKKKRKKVQKVAQMKVESPLPEIAKEASKYLWAFD